MKYFTKFLCQFVSFFLVFTIGFLSCIGVVVGGAAFVYCNVSIDKLNEWGAGIDTSGTFDPKADVPVNSLTLETLLGEILGIQGNSGKYSLQDLIDRYGLILPEEIAQYLPSDVILNTALETLTSQDGLITILKNTPLNYLLQFVPEGVMSEEAKETMGTVALYDIIFPEDENYASFLDEVQLGFFLGVSYTKDAAGNYVVDQQGEHPTLLELLAPINLGLVLGLFTNSGAPESTVANVIYQSLGHIVYEDLLYSLGLDLSSIDIADNILADRSVGDLFRDENGDGVYELYIPGAAQDLYLGTILGVDGEVVDGKFVVNYKDENRPTILELLAPLDFGGILAALLDEDYGKTALEVVFDTLGEIEFNQLFGSFLQLDKIGMEEALVGKKIKDLIHFEDGKPVLDVAGLFEGVYVGDFLGVKHYIDEDGNYVISEDDDSSAIARLVAFIDVGRIVSALLPEEGGFDANKVIDATYNQVATIRFIDILHVFVPDTESITGLDKALGDKTIGTVLSFDVETGKFDLHVPDVFKDIYLADFFGIPYHIDANGKVIIDDEIDTPLKLIAHISAYDFVNAIFEGDIFEVLYQTFGRIYFEDIFNLIPGFISAEYGYLYEGWQIGDLIVYDGTKWRFEGGAYWDALDFDRVLGDLKNNPDPAAIGILAAVLAGRLVYLLFFNDISFREYIATTYDNTTLLNTVDKFVDTEELRIDRLLGDIDIGCMFVRNDASGEYDLSWYDPIKDIAFDDIVYIFVDYEAQGVEGIFGDATIGDLLVRDENGNFSFEPENALGFVYLDDLLNFILNFVGQDLEGIGLGGLYDDLPLAAIVIVEDGKVSARPDALFDNLRGTAWSEFEQAFKSPLALRSLVLFGTYAVAVAYDYFLDRDNFLAISFDRFIEDYNITNDAICEIIAGKTVRDLLGDELSDIPTSFIRFNENVRLVTVLRLFGLDGNEAVNTIVSDTAFGDIVYVDESGKIQARPLAVVEGIRFADILNLCGVTNEKVLNIVGDKRIGDLFHYDPDAEVKFDFTPLRLLGDIAFRQVVDVFYPVEDGTPLAEVLDALGTVTSLVCRDTEGNYHFTPVEWVQDIRFMTLVELARLQELIDRDLSAIFGDMTIGDILYYEDEDLRFEWFALFRDIAFNAILDLFALPEQIGLPLHRLFTETDGSDKTIGSLVNYSAEEGFSVTWYPFVDDMHIIEVANMAGYSENEALNRLLGDVTVGDIIAYDEEAKKVNINELTYLSLTDLVNTILSFLGTNVEEQNIADLLADLSVASLITFGDGFKLDLDPIVDRLVRHDVRLFLDDPTSARSLTIVGVMLVWALYGYFADTDTFLAREFNTYLAQFEAGTPYGHRANEDYLYDIFADKTFGDLLPRNLADFPQTLVRFLDGVSFYTVFGLLKIENRFLHNLLDEFYFNNIIFVNDEGAVDFHLENLDKIKFADIARLAGLRNHTLLSIIADMDLADLVTYNYNEKKFSFTPLEMIADIRLNTLFGFFDGISPETREVLDRMFDTTVGEIIYKDADGKVVFKPFALTDKIVMTDILAVAGLDRAGHEDLYDLLDGKTLKDVITSDDQTLKDVSVTLFETLFGYEVYDVLSAIVTLPNPGAWQTLLGHRTFSDLFSFTGLFENFAFTFDRFFGSMRWVDIIYAATGFEGSNIVALFGEKTIGTVLSISEGFDVSFTPFKLTDDMALVTILALAGIENDKVTRLLSGITLGDFVTSPDGSLTGVEVNAIQTILGLKVVDVIGLFYENERLNALLGARRFDDLVKVTGLFEDVTLTFDSFFGNMKWVDIIYAATGFEGSNIVALFGEKTIGTVLSIGTDFTVSFTPFKLTDDMALVTILALAGIENEKVTRLLSGITLSDFVTSPDGSLSDLEINAIQTVLDLKVLSVIELFYENEQLAALLGTRRFSDLVKVTGLFEDVTLTFDNFFGTMKWTDILAVFGLEGSNVDELFGEKTIGTVLSIGTDFTVSFTPFALTDNMSLVTILALAGIENDKVANLLSGITLSDFVTSPDGSLSDLEINAIQTILGLKVVDVIGLFYENERLNALLGARRFDDLVKVTGLFEDVTLTFDDFFGTMSLCDIVAVFAPAVVEDGKPLAAILGETRIGDIISISPAFDVTFAPFALTDNVALTDVLALFGLTEGKVVDFFTGIYGRDLVTYEDGAISVTAISTVLNFKVYDVIALFYENERLSALLGDRRFGDLVRVTGLFEDIALTFDNFFGSMKWTDIIYAATGIEGSNIVALFGQKTIGTVLSISEGFDVSFTPFKLTDDMALNTFLAIAGITGTKLNDLLDGLTLRDFVTSPDGSLKDVEVTAIQTALDLSLVKLIGLFYEDAALTRLLTKADGSHKTLGTLVQVTGLFETVNFTWHEFVRDMKIVDILRACYVDRVAPQIDLDELFGTKTVGDLVAQDENGANTRLTLKKFLEDANIIGFSAILDATGIDPASALGTALYNLIGDKYIADLLSFDEENNLTFTWYSFIADMELREFARMAGLDVAAEPQNSMFGTKTLGDLVGKDAEGNVYFRPFKLTDDIALLDILTLAGLTTGEKLNTLLSGITLRDLVTSPDGSLTDVEVTAIQTVLDLSLVKLIGLFYENAALTRLLTKADGSDKSLGTLVQVTGLFETVNLDIDAFVGNMKLMDFVGLTGGENASLQELLGDATIGDFVTFNGGVKLQPIDFITLDAIANFALSFAGTDLLTLGLDRIVDGIYVSQVMVVSADGSVTFTAQPIIDNLDMEAEINAILNDPFALRSLVFMGVGAAVLLYLWFFDRDVLLDLAFIPDLLGETEDVNLRLIFEGKTVRDLLGEGFARLHINATKFLAGVPLSVIPGLLKYENEDLAAILGSTTVDDIFYVDEADQFHFKPFVLTDPVRVTNILGLCGVENEKALRLVEDITLEQLITSPHKTVFGIEIHAIQTLLALKVANTISVFYENEKLNALLGDRRFDDLVQVIGLFEDVNVTFDDFFGSMKWTDILAVFGLEGSNVDELFGEKTIGTVLSISPEFAVSFTPFALTDDMSLVTLLAFAGLENEKVTRLLDGVTLSDLVTSPDGTINNIQVPAIQTILGLKVANVIGLFYENAELNNLLGERRFDDLVQVTGLFESVSVTFDNFFGSMALCDIVAVFAPAAVEDGRPLAAILDQTRIGDILSVSPTFDVTFAPFALTDNVALTDVLALFGLTEGKVVNFLDGIYGRDIVTSEGGLISITAIQTVLNFKVADTISLFYENEKLNSLLGDRRFVDLVQVNGLFASISVTFDAFFGGMKWVDILAVFGVEGYYIEELFGEKTTGTVISIDGNYNMILTPFKLTDDMRINTFLGMFGVEGTKVNVLFDGITLGDFVTSPDGSVFNIEITAIRTILAFKLADLIGLTGVSHMLIDAICTDKSFDDFILFDGTAFGFSFSGLFGDVVINNVLDGILSFIGRSLEGWDMTFLFEGMVVTDLIDIKDGAIEQHIIEFVKGLDFKRIINTIRANPFSEPSLVYIAAALVGGVYLLATDMDGMLARDLGTYLSIMGVSSSNPLYRLLSGHRLNQLINVKGTSFATILTWYDFVSDMVIADILAVVKITNSRILTIVGTKTVGELVAQKEDGTYELTIVDFLGTLTMGDVFGTEGAKKQLIADFYLADFYRVLKGNEGLTSLIVKRMGEKELYEIFKTAMGEQERLKTMLGHIAVNDVLVDDGAGGYRFDITVFETIPAGSLLGYTKHEDGYWYDTEGVRVSGIVAAVADLTLQNMSTEVGNIKLGTVFGYTEGADGKWYDGEAEATGLLAIFASLSINDMSDSNTVTEKIKTIQVKDVLGLTEHDGVWYTDYENGTKASPIIGALAESNVGNIEESVNNIHLGTVFGYSPVYDETHTSITDWQDAEGNSMQRGVLRALANSTIRTIGDDIDNVLIGDVAGYVKVGTTWYSVYSDDGNDDNDVVATGVLKAFADLTIADMKDSNAVASKVQTVVVGDVMGYTKIGDTWYVDAEGNTAVSALMQTIAGSTVGGLNETIDNATIGSLFGYKLNAEGKWVDAGGTEISGYMKLVGPDTPFKDLNNKINSIKDTATIGEFIDAGLLELDGDAQANLDRVYAYRNPTTYPETDWRDLNLTRFVSWMVSLTTMIP